MVAFLWCGNQYYEGRTMSKMKLSDKFKKEIAEDKAKEEKAEAAWEARKREWLATAKEFAQEFFDNETKNWEAKRHGARMCLSTPKHIGKEIHDKRSSFLVAMVKKEKLKIDEIEDYFVHDDDSDPEWPVSASFNTNIKVSW
jgi:hypothetical protein